jgi:hypothetical protein
MAERGLARRERGVWNTPGMATSPGTAHALRNRELWNQQSDEYQAQHGPQLAASGGLAWGAAQWSIALHRLGARLTGLDYSERQLEHARRLMAEAGVDFPVETPIADLVWPSTARGPGRELAVEYWGLRTIGEPDEPLMFQLRYGEWIEWARRWPFEHIWRVRRAVAP